MTVATYALGRPRLATSRGGDCAVYDLSQDGRRVGGPHRFAAPEHCHITNGMLRLTVSAAGAAPSLAIDAWRGRVVVGDTYEDVYTDDYGGEISTPAWFDMGTVVMDSPSVSSLLTGVRLVKVTAEIVALRLICPLLGDAYVVLRRGEPMVRIQHGDARPPLVPIVRRIAWADPLSGYAVKGRVEETPPAIDSFLRFVAAVDPVTADAVDFSVTTPSVTTARFGAGVGTWALGNRPIDLHRQLLNATRNVVVT